MGNSTSLEDGWMKLPSSPLKLKTLVTGQDVSLNKEEFVVAARLNESNSDVAKMGIWCFKTSDRVWRLVAQYDCANSRKKLQRESKLVYCSIK